MRTWRRRRRRHFNRGLVFCYPHASTCCSCVTQVWRDLLRGWRQPRRQHDVCEFACFVLDKLRPSMLHGEWSARRHDPMLGEFAHGCLFNPIPLCIPDNAHSIQDCIHSWNDQARTTAHALTHTVEVVVIQLARFTQLSGGRYRKFHGTDCGSTPYSDACFLQWAAISVDSLLALCGHCTHWSVAVLRPLSGVFEE